jgi:glycine cleavage system H protein|tara:strand:+ start:4128 stop:4505 length:378 start_codon:yes stop_codon:yes gene_type:complete
MSSPNELKYTEDHEWVKIDGDIAIIGITDHAQSELGDIIFIEFPEVNNRIEKTEPFGTIEAVKTVADLFAPISGKILEINEALEDSPELVNSDAYGEGWVVKVSVDNPNELKELLSSENYEKLIG